MIYPTRRAVFLVAVGIPMALLLGILAPRQWHAGVAWAIFVTGTMLLDISVAGRRSSLRIGSTLPNGIAIGQTSQASFALLFAGNSAPREAEVALDVGARIRISPLRQFVGVADRVGRLMSEPVAGQLRLDRALHAILLLSYAGLKIGDRVGLFAFDERPRLRSGTVAGAAAFPLLQRLASQLDYSTAETNFTLGLTQLATDLKHRSIVVIFTDFVDTTSAELMLENIGRLLQRHLVLFVLFRDVELEEMALAKR